MRANSILQGSCAQLSCRTSWKCFWRRTAFRYQPRVLWWCFFICDAFILQIFAPALRACIVGSDIQVISFADTSEEVVCDAVDASVNFMKQRLLQAHRKVKNIVRAKAKIQEETDKQPNKKFSIREMSTGSIDDFHEGLHDRIGEGTRQSVLVIYFRAPRQNSLRLGNHSLQ